MATTSVHIPKPLLQQLDELAQDRGISRNRLILEGVHHVLATHRERWPPGYLEGEHLEPGDMELLQAGGAAFGEAVIAARQSKREAPF